MDSMGGAVTVGTWWDMDSCKFPLSLDPYLLLSFPSSLLSRFGISDSIDGFSLTAYHNQSTANQSAEELTQTILNAGFHLCTPYPGDSIEKMVIADIFMWAMENPPPATIVLMIGSYNLTYCLALLRNKGYRILALSSCLDEMPLSMFNACHSILPWKPFLSQMQGSYDLDYTSQIPALHEQDCNSGLQEALSEQGDSVSEQRGAEEQDQELESHSHSQITEKENPCQSLQRKSRRSRRRKSHSHSDLCELPEQSSNSYQQDTEEQISHPYQINAAEQEAGTAFWKNQELNSEFYQKDIADVDLHAAPWENFCQREMREKEWEGGWVNSEESNSQQGLPQCLEYKTEETEAEYGSEKGSVLCSDMHEIASLTSCNESTKEEESSGATAKPQLPPISSWEFKKWLENTVKKEPNKSKGYSISQIPKDVQNDTGMCLSLSTMGCSRLMEAVMKYKGKKVIVKEVKPRYFVAFPADRNKNGQAPSSVPPTPGKKKHGQVPSSVPPTPGKKKHGKVSQGQQSRGKAKVSTSRSQS